MAIDVSSMSDEDLAAYAKGDYKSMSDKGLATIAAQKPEAKSDTQTGPGNTEKPATPSLGRQFLDVGKDIAGTVARGAGTAYGAVKNVINGTADNPSDTGAAWHAPFEHPEDTEPTIHAAMDRASQAVPLLTATRMVGTAAHAGQQALEHSDSPAARFVGDVTGPASDIAQGVGTVMGAKSLLSAGADAAGGLYRAATPDAAAAIPPSAQRAVQNGYKISPSTVQELNPGKASAVPGTTAESLEPASVTRQRQLDNANTTNTKIQQHFGTPNEIITNQDLENAKVQAPPGSTPGQTGVQAGEVDPRSPAGGYERAANSVNGRAVTGDLQKDFDRVGTLSTAVTPGAEAQIQGLINKFKTKYPEGSILSGSDTMSDVSDLRSRARRLMTNDAAPEAWDQGMASRRLADALESEMQRHMEPSVANGFEEARTRFAQINDAQTALRAGSIDPKVLLRLRQSGTPLSGPLADIADAAEHAPNDVVHPQDAVKSEGADLSVRGALRAGARRIFGSKADQAITSRVGEAPEAPRPEGTLTAPDGTLSRNEQGVMNVEQPPARPDFALESPPAPPQTEKGFPQYQPPPPEHKQVDIRFPHHETPGVTAYEPHQRPIDAAPEAGTLTRSADQVAPKLSSAAWQKKLADQLADEQRARAMLEQQP